MSDSAEPSPIPPEEREPARMWPADMDPSTEREQDYYHPPAPGGGYASWGTRVLGTVLDGVVISMPVLIGQIILVFSGGRFGLGDLSDASTFGWVAYLTGAVVTLAVGIWNVLIRQGRTGQTLGKSWVGIRLIRQADGQVLGVFMTFIRQLAHILDALPCYLGYLWPLWDEKRQTFADKIMDTTVVRV